MNLPQALEIVKDHIRIGKGMELTNGVPEALEMVVEELEQSRKCDEANRQIYLQLRDKLEITQRALELACKVIGRAHKQSYCVEGIKGCNKSLDYECRKCWEEHILNQAKEARDEQTTD